MKSLADDLPNTDKVREEILKQYFRAIETRLQELVRSGVPLDQIHLDQYIHKPETIIVVGGKIDTSFTLTTTHLNPRKAP